MQSKKIINKIKKNYSKNKKFYSILFIITGLPLIFLPDQYALLSLFFFIFGSKQYNRAFLEKKFKNVSEIPKKVHEKFSSLKKFWIFISLLIIVSIIVVYASFIEGVSGERIISPSTIVALISIPFILFYFFIDRYESIAAYVNPHEALPFIKKNHQIYFAILITGIIIWLFLPFVNKDIKMGVGSFLFFIGFIGSIITHLAKHSFSNFHYLTNPILYTNKNITNKNKKELVNT